MRLPQSVDFHTKTQEARKNCKPKELAFVFKLISGLTEEAAYCEVWGEKHKKRAWYIRQRVEKLLAGPAGVYYGLLNSRLNDMQIMPHVLNRAEKMQLLSMGAVEGYAIAQSTSEPAGINAMVRCINELNRISGDHAPERVEVESHIKAAFMHARMSDVEATEMYKQVMQGARIALEHENDKSKSERIIEAVEYEPIIKKEN